MSYLLLVLSLLVFAYGLLSPVGYLKPPALMGAVFGLWYAVQLILVGQNPMVPTSAVNVLALTAILCLLMALLGWHLALQRQSMKRASGAMKPPEAYTPSSMVPAVVAITVFSMAMNLAVQQLRPDMADIQQWTGPIVIFSFFASLRVAALVLSFLLFFRLRTPTTILLVVINLIICVPIAVVLLRRAEMIDIGLAIAGALWFGGRIRISLPVIVAGLVAFSVIVFSMGPLRKEQNRIEYETGQTVSLVNPVLWQELDISQTVGDNAEKAHDVRNAVYIVAAVDELGEVAYGAGLWNNLVRQYVPSQFVGPEFKRSLQVEGANIDTQYLANEYNFFFQTGTTSTGPGSAYSDLGYFGSLFFLIVGYILGVLYSNAVYRGPFWQAAYLSVLPFSLTAITHGYDKFFVMAPLYFLALWALSKISKMALRREIAFTKSATFTRYRGRLSTRTPTAR